ncbi:Crhr1 [Columba guinea]|nr:Crhr1 [Columba guinea]
MLTLSAKTSPCVWKENRHYQAGAGYNWEKHIPLTLESLFRTILLYPLGNRDGNRNVLIFIDFIVVEEGRYICSAEAVRGSVSSDDIEQKNQIRMAEAEFDGSYLFFSRIAAKTQGDSDGPQCNASVDLIGTCWPRSAVGQLVARPCPEYFYGVRYNTTSKMGSTGGDTVGKRSGNHGDMCDNTSLGTELIKALCGIHQAKNNGYRECLANGSWAARVNYSQCQEILSEEKKSKLHYHVAVIINYLGHCVSLGALLVAFVLFMRLRSIRCLRNIIHWNLITAFILRNATWFVVQLTMNPEVHESNVVWCRLVTAAYNYFHVTNFFWMFGEGCYLHTAIVLTYSTDKLRKWMFICIGWCIPFPIIVAWAIGKLYYDNEKCWFGKRAGVYTDYIYQGPMILVLLGIESTRSSSKGSVPIFSGIAPAEEMGENAGGADTNQVPLSFQINFIFLFNIVRILMTKLRASTTSETIQYRKAVKATLVLLPLLGITYMLFFVNPGEDEISRIVFIYFNSFLESFQGFFVSVFYCFLNSEVRSAVRKRWHRWQDKHSIRARVARAMSIPTSPTRVSFHSIKQSSAV